MKKQHITVVTNVEHGWDCVVAVYDSDSISEEYLERQYPSDDGYVCHGQTLKTEEDSGLD